MDSFNPQCLSPYLLPPWSETGTPNGRILLVFLPPEQKYSGWGSQLGLEQNQLPEIN